MIRNNGNFGYKGNIRNIGNFGYKGNIRNFRNKMCADQSMLFRTGEGVRLHPLGKNKKPHDFS
jgi:hypothetical protein